MNPERYLPVHTTPGLPPFYPVSFLAGVVEQSTAELGGFIFVFILSSSMLLP